MMFDNQTQKKALTQSILAIAIPISCQSLFQSFLSVIDQIMVGQLGTNSIAAIGLGARFPNLFMVTLSAVATAASIMISQYCGSKDSCGMNYTFFSNGLFACLITLVFMLPSLLISNLIIELYTTDIAVISMAAEYLRIIAIGYIPLLVITMLSAVLRSIGKAKYPMFSSIFSVGMNTLLNYILIFGKFGIPALGLKGAAIATTSARIAECLLLFFFFCRNQKKSEFKIHIQLKIPIKIFKKTLIILSPILLNEFLWGLGETLYAVVYGHIGTEQMAAMTLTAPIQGLTIGLFTGISAAAAILVSNNLGKNDNLFAYTLSCKFIKYGILGSLFLGGLLVLMSGIYSNLYHVSDSTKHTTIILLYVFAGFLFVKVTNMILAGGILRSGGKTKYTLFMDILGTWGIGIPLGFLSAFVWKLPIYWVYLLISTEEVVRLIIAIFIFKSKKWMKNITK